ncbi:MAG: Stage V sporulation protein E [Candidatus Daviesbacteria bacterium GW2011_GWA1_41_61]|uniref:Probable peptidoglycan glycosyltransferase FtsW n=1 Tax=Candidatus Daviesbacteria bacterium GW2011_GWA2_40_9 TaxID=1618424 RepID=A0A0G0U1I7_9BACT|nr:MAG: Stage V sporulation protein E [Candidatus Daviesbacteria bacterium GW2011_GWC1_40_9]KKR82978.1 MAG: Stage V sporulation protein E [Candidatus Daviesbacteria bacterium GW2011_GWA2_40_9]KKR92904.1 MAG: Stage V sporulation protein E [Candidatus Daviesbacteria bacterium GW2011_GWB1_41_15]KKS15448.1 MAG: Stage V sporulation protein E [Candidatus Daviesbacteria bacterium GW2011_GWA1_41_61]
MRRLKVPAFSKEEKKSIYQSPRVFTQQHKIDWVLLGSVIFLSLFGLLMVYDASQFEAYRDFGDKYYFIKQQVIWLLMGLGALAFFSFFDYHRLQKFALPFFIFSVLLLLLVFIPGLGISAGGAHRWLKFPGFNVQPAEIIKLSAIIFLSAIFCKSSKSFPFFVILGLVGIILGIFQKDLGSAIIFSMIAFSVYFVAEAPLAHFIGLSLISLVSAMGFILIAPYRIKRVLAFLDPFADPQGFSYHISQVLIALGSGGLLGLGVGQSRQKFAYIPEVTTDSIFSVIGEEFGFLGSLVLIFIIGFLILRGFKIAQTAVDSYGKLLAVGLTTWLGVQAVINLAAMVSLMPLTGVPLPFISYGGSALLANLVAVGILLNISKQNLR